jgi:hypothetical protein
MHVCMYIPAYLGIPPKTFLDRQKHFLTTYMYACMHACVYAQMQVSHIHKCIWAYIQSYVHKCIWTDRQTYVNTHMHACTSHLCTCRPFPRKYVCMHVCMHVCTHMCTCGVPFTCVYVCMYECTHVFTCEVFALSPLMYVCTYACMHIHM